MKDYKTTGYLIYDCKYHIVRIIKYRYAVLTGLIGQRVRELIRGISRRYYMRIYAGSVNRDHIIDDNIYEQGYIELLQAVMLQMKFGKHT